MTVISSTETFNGDATDGLQYGADGIELTVATYALVYNSAGAGVSSTHNDSTLVNNGIVYGGIGFNGASLTGDNAVISNNAGARIRGYNAISLNGDGATITNHGEVIGTGGAGGGITLGVNATNVVLHNDGDIHGTTRAIDGASLAGGAVVSNAGLVSGDTYGIQLLERPDDDDCEYRGGHDRGNSRGDPDEPKRRNFAEQQGRDRRNDPLHCERQRHDRQQGEGHRRDAPRARRRHIRLRRRKTGEGLRRRRRRPLQFQDEPGDWNARGEDRRLHPWRGCDRPLQGALRRHRRIEFRQSEGQILPCRHVAHDANDRIIYDDATGKLYYDRDGTGSAHQKLFARLDGKPELDHHDLRALA